VLFNYLHDGAFSPLDQINQADRTETKQWEKSYWLGYLNDTQKPKIRFDLALACPFNEQQALI